MDDVERAVLDLERYFWDHSSEAGFLEAALTDDALTVAEPWGFIDKPSAVQMNQGTQPWQDVEMQDVRTMRVSEDSVAIVYHASSRRVNEDETYSVSVVSVYARRGGDWKLALTVHQPWERA